MRIGLIDSLICPNTGRPGFTIFAARLQRGGQTIVGVEGNSIDPADEVVDGLLLSSDKTYAYPIRSGVLSMLSDHDVDLLQFKDHLDYLRPNLPPDYLRRAYSVSDRVQQRQVTAAGRWNREEMRYYDTEVETPEKRAAMCETIKGTYLPHIYVPRQKHIIEPLKSCIAGRTVVEIGCGNARTIAILMPPENYRYHYIGSDISFWRLAVAKTVCPEGEFIQASALNLPLSSECADVGISFGVLHHLPRPADALRDLIRTLRPGAHLGFHEPITTRKLITGRFQRLEDALQTYEHSQHDGEVDLKLLVDQLEKEGYKVERKEFLASPFRTAIEAIARRLNKNLLRSRRLFRFLLTADRFFIWTVCRASQLLSPRAVILLAKSQNR